MMKKKLVLYLLLFLIGCTEDTLVETNLEPNESQKFTITVSSDYFEERDFYTSTNYVFVTDKNGEIITEGTLENNQTTELVIEQLSKNETFDLTIVKRQVSPSLTNYSLTTFSSLSPSNITLQNETEEILETNIKIENTDGFIQMMLMGGISQEFNSNDNIGHVEIRARVQSSYNNFYVPFKNASSGTYKYIWLEDVKNNLAQTFEYNELPTPAMSRNLDFADEITSRTIYGLKLGEYHLVDAASAPVQLPEDFVGPQYDLSNTNTGTFYYPENFFDEFKLHYCIFTDDKSYIGIQPVGEEDISLPKFDFQTIDKTFENFEVITEGYYDIHKAQFFYSKKTGHTFNVGWDYFGQSKDVINIVLPKIIDKFLLDKHSEFTLSDIENTYISLYKFDGLNSYNDFVEKSHDFICNSKFQLENLNRFEEVTESYRSFE